MNRIKWTIAHRLNWFKTLFPQRHEVCWWMPVPSDEIYLMLRSFELTERQFVRSYLKRGQVFWDIGANFGLYTLTGAKRVGSDGTVIAFEPDPRNYQRLRRNVLINRLGQVKMLPFALGEEKGEIEFAQCSQGGYSGLKVGDVPGTTQTIKVPQRSLDDVAEELGWPQADLVKIDVEGSELMVLKGGEKFFSEKARPVLMIEIAEKRTIPLGYHSKEIFDWLAERDYRWFRLESDLKLTELSQSADYFENLVACPAEKLELLNQN